MPTGVDEAPTLYTTLLITPFWPYFIPNPVDKPVDKYPNYPVDNPYLSTYLLITLCITLAYSKIDSHRRWQKSLSTPLFTPYPQARHGITYVVHIDSVASFIITFITKYYKVWQGMTEYHIVIIIESSSSSSSLTRRSSHWVIITKSLASSHWYRRNAHGYLTGI